MKTKATLALDDCEMELLIIALTRASSGEIDRGNENMAAQFRIVGRKAIEELARFQHENLKFLEEKYCKNEEKPRFAEPTFQG